MPNVKLSQTSIVTRQNIYENKWIMATLKVINCLFIILVTNLVTGKCMNTLPNFRRHIQNNSFIYTKQTLIYFRRASAKKARIARRA